VTWNFCFGRKSCCDYIREASTVKFSRARGGDRRIEGAANHARPGKKILEVEDTVGREGGGTSASVRMQRNLREAGMREGVRRPIPKRKGASRVGSGSNPAKKK